MKKIVFASLAGLALFIIIGGGAAWFVFNYMQKTKFAVETPLQTRAAEKKKQHANDIFVPLKELVITLGDAEGSDHYMLLEVTMVADSEEVEKKIRADEPLYQSIILAALADMKYERVRALKVEEIKSLLSTTLSRELKKRTTPNAYNEILINKLVFQ